MQSFEIQEPYEQKQDEESFFQKYKYYIIGGFVAIVILSVLLWYFLRKTDESKTPSQPIDPKISLLTVMTSDDTDFYTDTRVRREYLKFYNLVKNILGNATPKVCYNIDKIKNLKPETLTKERNIDILVRPAVENALKRKNYYDIAALYLQMMRTINPDYDSWLITVDRESNGVTPRTVKISKDGNLVNPTPLQLIQKYSILYRISDTDLNSEPLISFFNAVKNSPSYNNNVMSMEDLANLLTLLMLMKLKNTVSYIGYQPCDV
jgi:hypothetical protein